MNKILIIFNFIKKFKILVIILLLIIFLFVLSQYHWSKNISISFIPINAPLLIGENQIPIYKIIIDVPDDHEYTKKNEAVILEYFLFNLISDHNNSGLNQINIHYSDDDHEINKYNLAEVDAKNFKDGSEKIKHYKGVLIDSIKNPINEFSFKINKPLNVGKNYFLISVNVSSLASIDNRISLNLKLIKTSLGNKFKSITSLNYHRYGIALRRHMDDNVHTYRIPSIITSRSGTLLVVYDVRRNSPGRDLQSDIDIGLSRSINGGLSWEPMRIILDMGKYGSKPESENGVSDAALLVDQKTGIIYCFAIWMHGKPGQHQWLGEGSESGFGIGKTAQFLMIKSIDDGKTWSKPVNLTRMLKKVDWKLLAPSPSRGLSLADGTLVLPVQGRISNDVPFSSIMISKDHGITWLLKSNVTGVSGSEPQIVELENGSLMLNIRTEQLKRDETELYRTIYTTHDLGETWKAHSTNRNSLIDSGCNAGILKFRYKDDGKSKSVLLFSNPNSKIDRSNQALKISFDDGNSWSGVKILLDEGKAAGYVSLTKIDDNKIGIVYEGSRAQLTFQRINIFDILK